MAAKKKTADAPKGFRKVETSLVGFWKPEKAGQWLQGIVESGVAAKSKDPDGEGNTFFVVQVTHVDGAGPVLTTDGEIVDLESDMLVGVGGKMLLPFLRARVGKEVYLSYAGLGPKKPGQNAPKMYDTFEATK